MNEESGGAAPVLTAAVVIGEQRDRAGVCVERLLEQSEIGSMEIVVADLAPELPLAPAFEHPRVRRLALTGEPDYATARGAAARASRGEFIAYLEDHSYPDPGWAAAILEAFRRRAVAIVNYAFRIANEPSYVANAVMFTEYGRWMAPAREGPLPIPSCNNIAYRRTALEPYWDRLEFWLEGEFLLHRKILAEGGGVWLAPDAVLAHECWPDLWPACLANGSMKRLVAVSRVEAERWGLARRILYAGGMAITPLQGIWRLARSVPGRPGMWRRFFASLPVTAAVYTYSAACEAVGYLAGAGTSRDDFRDVELSMGRE